MEEIRKLEEKINKKKDNTNIDYIKVVDSYRNDVKQLYDKVCRAEDNLMKKMRYIDRKQDKILELLEQNNNVNLGELQRQQEIKELENRLKELRGE